MIRLIFQFKAIDIVKMENKLILESKSVNPKKATLSKILAFKQVCDFQIIERN